MIKKRSGWDLKNEAILQTNVIENELISRFGVSKYRADEMVRIAGVIDTIMDNPDRINDSLENWLMIVLLRNNDHSSIAKYIKGSI